jgi:hypothetical protein
MMLNLMGPAFYRVPRMKYGANADGAKSHGGSAMAAIPAIAAFPCALPGSPSHIFVILRRLARRPSAHFFGRKNNRPP